MEIEQIRELCLTLPQTTEDIKWGDNLCFMVHEKIFLMISMDNYPISGTLKVNPFHFDDIIEDFNAKQAPYFARNQWITFLDVESLKSKEIKQFILESYKMIVDKLPKKQKMAIFELLKKNHFA